MTLPHVSVILPVYNVAPYLTACLDSLAAQTLPPDEIIAIDDGSTDESPYILEQYSKHLPTLRVIRRENGGLSVARNTGLEAARGKWLSFIDSDDFIEPDYFSSLVSIAESGDLDVALCNAFFHYDGERPDRPIYTDSPETNTEPGREWLRNRLQQRFFPHMVWMHLYKRSFLEENNFRFIPEQVHEDVIWTNQVLLLANRVRYINKPLYKYRIRQSRSGADLMRRSREFVIPCSVTNTTSISDMADTLSDDPELQNLMRWQAADSGNAIFHLINKLPSRKDRLAQLDNLWKQGFIGLMWHNSQTISQKRKVLRKLLSIFLRTT